MTADTIPVTVAQDAEARVAELGMRREFEMMIERARRVLSGLRHLRVTLEYDPVRPQDDPQIVIWAHRDEPPPDKLSDMTEWQEWVKWECETFPPRVRLNILLTTAYGGSDGW
jgi:hypothetical protein